jgi:hypothetical protein
LENAVRHNWNISVVSYRAIKATTEFVGVLLVGAMWAAGPLPPTVAALVIGGIIFGVETFETFLQAQGVRLEEQNAEGDTDE